MAYRRASLIDLYLQTKISVKSEKLFVDRRTDRPTYVRRTDGQTSRPALLGEST